MLSVEIDEENRIAILEPNGALSKSDFVSANAGGVTVSYFEWVQNRSGQAWTLEDVQQKLKEKMISAFEEVWDLAENEQRTLREAAYVKALRRISCAVEAHGTRDYFSHN